jgi:protein TonB
MPISQSLEQADFILKPTKMGDIQLNCLNRKNASGNPSGVTYCLDVQLPVLRGTAAPEGLERTARNGYVSFQGHYIAQDLQILYSSKESLTAHLDSIESLTTIDEAVFAPPSNAIPRSITSGVKIVTGATSVGFLIKKVDPIYPQSALIYHASGTVVIQTTIGKDGHTHDLHAISGPSELQQAALDAVKQWVYRPYLLNNEPVEVQTTVSIVFDIHR